MKPKTQEKMFWVMLATINMVAMIYLVSLCVRVGIDDGLAAPVKASLGIVLLLVTIDAGTVLVDYRRWREQAEMQAQVRQTNRSPGDVYEHRGNHLRCRNGTSQVPQDRENNRTTRNSVRCVNRDPTGWTRGLAAANGFRSRCAVVNCTSDYPPGA